MFSLECVGMVNHDLLQMWKLSNGGHIADMYLPRSLTVINMLGMPCDDFRAFNCKGFVFLILSELLAIYVLFRILLFICSSLHYYFRFVIIGAMLCDFKSRIYYKQREKYFTSREYTFKFFILCLSNGSSA